VKARLPWQSVLSVAAAIAYGVSPVDLIPDILLLIGWVDDVTIGGLLLMLAIRFFLSSRKRSLAQPLPARPQFP